MQFIASADIRRGGSKQYLGEVMPWVNPTLSGSAMWGVSNTLYPNIGDVRAVC